MARYGQENKTLKLLIH